MDHQHRDRVLRSYFAGRDWDENPEFKLKRHLVLKGDPALADWPYVIDDEWEVWPGNTDQGRGDLLFSDGAGRFAVVEVKFIDLGRTGATARSKRTDSRGKVADQARVYAQALPTRYPDQVAAVAAFAFTNEQGLVPVPPTRAWQNG